MQISCLYRDSSLFYPLLRDLCCDLIEMFVNTHNICSTHMRLLTIPQQKELLLVDIIVGELVTQPEPRQDFLLYETLITNMERRFRPKEEREVAYVIRIDEQVE